MFLTAQDRRRLNHVEIDRLERCLHAAGWTPDETTGDWKQRHWERPGHVVAVPQWTGFADYRQRIADVVETLARVEGRYPDAILDELLWEESA